MNTSEANAINSVLRWVTGQGGNPDHVLIDAMWLADRAHHRLGAGLTPDDVAAHWPNGEGVTAALHRSAEGDVSAVIELIEQWQNGADPGDTLRAIRDQLAGRTPGGDGA